MKRWGTMILVIVWALLAVPGAHAQDGDTLIRNGDFGQGLEFWTTGQACASCTLGVVSDGAGGSRLTWQRTNSGGDGAALTARQDVQADVSRYDRLLLRMTLGVVSHSLPNSGWWSDANNGSGEYPVKVTLYFTDAAGQSFEWNYGFLTQHDGSTQLQNYMLVTAGQSVQVLFDVFSPTQWVDPRGNPLPQPATLTAVAIGGSGWDFNGWVESIQVTGEPGSGSGGADNTGSGTGSGTGTGGDTTGGGTGTGGDSTGGGTSGGTGSGLTGCEMNGLSLTVEEYPIVSAAEDQPDHFEFKDRLPQAMLDLRRAYREPDSSTILAEPNDVLAKWGYKLVPHDNTYSLYVRDTELISDVTTVWPIAVNASGTDFRLLLDAMTAPLTLVVVPDTVGYVDSATWAYIAPVYVGDDLIEITADWSAGTFNVLRNGQVIYTVVPDAPFVELPVKSLSSWNGHWVLSMDDDILIDGQSLSAQAGYESAFDWGLIAGQPFYFFSQNGQIAMSYACQIVEPYRYSDVIHTQCCEGSMFNASSNAFMVWFYGLKDGIWTYVEAGLYAKGTPPPTQ